MVRSLDPYDGDYRAEPGRRLTNADIGYLMRLRLAESIARYDPGRRGDETRESLAVRRLLDETRKQVDTENMSERQIRRSVVKLLRNRADAIERKGRFIAKTSHARGSGGVDDAVERVMHMQDQRRAEHTFSGLTTAAARAVDAHESHQSNDLVVWQNAREDLQPPLHVSTSTSVARRPAPRHEMGGANPNADALRIMGPYGVLPRPNRILRLTHAPGGQLRGGFHDPIQL